MRRFSERKNGGIASDAHKGPADADPGSGEVQVIGRLFRTFWNIWDVDFWPHRLQRPDFNREMANPEKLCTNGPCSSFA